MNITNHPILNFFSFFFLLMIINNDQKKNNDHLKIKTTLLNSTRSIKRSLIIKVNSLI